MYSQTSDKGNLPTKDKLKVLLYTHSIENHILKEALQRTKRLVPKVSLLRGSMHCSQMHVYFLKKWRYTYFSDLASVLARELLIRTCVHTRL